VNDEKRARLVKVPLYRRLDRAQSKIKWYRSIRGGLKDINDLHSFQGAHALFERWNLFEEIFERIFDRKMSLLMDKYCLEYTQLLNVTLDKTYKYNA